MDLTYRCWQQNPEKRPTFNKIKEEIFAMTPLSNSNFRVAQLCTSPRSAARAARPSSFKNSGAKGDGIELQVMAKEAKEKKKPSICRMDSPAHPLPKVPNHAFPSSVVTYRRESAEKKKKNKIKGSGSLSSSFA